jgi:hypothetical protein
MYEFYCILVFSITHELLGFDSTFPEFSQLIVTVGEDCTCRMWGLDGKQVQFIIQHASVVLFVFFFF